MIVFLLNGCASDSTETQIESYDTQETLQVNKKEFSNRAGDKENIKERCEQIKAQIVATKSDYDKEKLHRRQQIGRAHV